jgi:hypothetical protein
MPKRTPSIDKNKVPRLDAANLAGITSLMNVTHLDTAVNMDEAERTIMKRSDSHKVDIDPVQLYANELNELAAELGIDLASAADEPPKSQPLVSKKLDQIVDKLDFSSDESEDDESSEESEEDESGDSSDNKSETSVIAGLEKGLNIDFKKKNDKRVFPIPGAANSNRERRQDLTNEEERRDHINSVLNEMRRETHTSYGVEFERTQDLKASKLEQISQLRMALEDEGYDCKAVTSPTLESPMEEIDSVLNILRLKNDRNRYATIAEEIILGAAEGIETVLDGTREIPILGWKPDYTGYSHTVTVKLHRMRYETSQVVSKVIEKYNIGPTTRILMELLPSFFLYPRQQKRQRGSPGLAEEMGGPKVLDAHQAYSNIRSSDNNNRL